MDSTDLEKRLQLIEDIEAIKKLKARYAQVCDDNYNPAEMVKLFTSDAVWISRKTGVRHEGLEAIRKYAEGVSRQIIFAVHYFVQPYIDVQGDEARAHWYLWCPATLVDGRGVWIAARENDKYRKTSGRWLISEIDVMTQFYTPFEEGWHRTKFI